VTNDQAIQNAIDVRIVNILKGMTLSIIVLAASIVWWAAEISSRVTTIEAGVEKMQTETARVAVTRAASIDRLSRLETDYLASKQEVARRLGRLEDKLDQILERLPRGP
jgi:hypothetical protein